MTPNQQYKDLGPDDVLQENDQFFIAPANTWHVIHPFLIGERVRDYFDTFRRPIPVQESTIVPGHHLERSGFCNVCGQPNEHVPCACVPVQEVEAGKKCSCDKAEFCEHCTPLKPTESEAGKEKCEHTFNQEERLSWLCSKCGMWEPDIELSRLEGENEELRMNFSEVYKELTTLRTQLDKAATALEPFAEIADLPDHKQNTDRCDFRWLSGDLKLGHFRLAQQTLADIKKGQR